MVDPNPVVAIVSIKVLASILVVAAAHVDYDTVR